MMLYCGFCVVIVGVSGCLYRLCMRRPLIVCDLSSKLACSKEGTFIRYVISLQYFGIIISLLLDQLCFPYLGNFPYLVIP